MLWTTHSARCGGVLFFSRTSTTMPIKTRFQTETQCSRGGERSVGAALASLNHCSRQRQRAPAATIALGAVPIAVAKGEAAPCSNNHHSPRHQPQSQARGRGNIGSSSGGWNSDGGGHQERLPFFSRQRGLIQGIRRENMRRKS